MYLSAAALLILFIILIGRIDIGWPIVTAVTMIGLWGIISKKKEKLPSLSFHDDLTTYSKEEKSQSNASAADIVTALDEPVLLVNQDQVEVANKAAQDLLGAHIEGGDIRLAIRHPAAIRRLTGVLEKDMPPVLLAGLGGLNRRWELYARTLNKKERLILLRDQSTAHLTEQVRIDFVANTSHELRTPLATLRGFIETLEDDEVIEDHETRHHFLGIMAREAKRMQNLVDDLMSLSRIEAGKFDPPKGTLTLLPLIEDVVSNLTVAGQAKESQIIIESQLSDSQLQGDRAELSQLLYNILGNALKYGRKDGKITINLTGLPDSRIRLALSDEGDGIPFHHIPRLTERFYRVDNSRSRSLGGTGLGLAIVKQIVEHHQGELDISSLAGKGTTVTVILPITNSHAE
ncbi:MAG: ATP-binding protein [Zymomonas mobilis subsp. pomaceae]|uniref:ATP-binding protein n=1 Tax=Zymomonas mobilis TaxID=542 RepID=UPI0039ECE823